MQIAEQLHNIRSMSASPLYTQDSLVKAWIAPCDATKVARKKMRMSSQKLMCASGLNGYLLSTQTGMGAVEPLFV